MVSAGGVIALSLFVLALASIVRDPHAGRTAKLAWTFVALVLPIIGSLLWFLLGKRYPYGLNGE